MRVCKVTETPKKGLSSVLKDIPADDIVGIFQSIHPVFGTEKYIIVYKAEA